MRAILDRGVAGIASRRASARRKRQRLSFRSRSRFSNCCAPKSAPMPPDREGGLGRHQTAGQARPLYCPKLSEGSRGHHKPPKQRVAGAIDARHSFVGIHPRPADHWHARQCACTDRFGKLTGRDRRGPCPIRDHRHHRVPTVDTLVAQRLITTISAAKLMGADCICSDIRPQIAQIIVQLGLDLSVTSKATMADAFAMALRRIKSPSRIARILPSCHIRLRRVFPDRLRPAQRRAISRLPLQSRRPLQYLSRASGLSGRAPKLSDQGENRRSRRAYSLALKTLEDYYGQISKHDRGGSRA